jgi:predicted SAM-dependent methyltransferase
MTAAWMMPLMRAAGVRDPAESRLLYRLRLLRRRFLGLNTKIINDYLRATDEPKLHIGGGWHLIEGWLNTDIALISGVMHMDATRSFPFREETFQFVFTEHMVEHIAYRQFVAMLCECRRVMRNGGIIRITTPDLNALIGLFSTSRSQIQERYIAFFKKHFLPEDYPDTPAAIVNTFFKSWGHTFIYDRETLEFALRSAGFHSIERRRLGESNRASLQHLEHEKRYPDGLLDYESIAVEAVK